MLPISRPRQVNATGKDDDGDITSLKGAFGDVPTTQAVREIERGTVRYAVGDSGIGVVNGATGKYLRSELDGRSSNNLYDLPEA